MSNPEMLYNKILTISRNKFFYTNIGLKDIYQIRAILIFFHASFLIIKLKTINDDKNIKSFSQDFFDCIFKKIESNLREGGYGDTSVNKNMKLLVKLFYAILLNCEKYSNLSLKKKIMLFDKYISINKDDQNQKLNELVKYFDKYESFCFSLPLNSVIKGELNFIY